MTKQTRTVNKSYFETGDTPTEAQFINLIDSSPNIIDDVADRYLKVELSSAQILSSNSSPVELIPTPGVGKMIVITELIEKLNYGTITYATNVNTNILYGTSGNAAVDDSIDLSNTVDTTFISIKAVASDASSNFENNSIIFKTETGNPTAGNGTITVHIWYKEITL